MNEFVAAVRAAGITVTTDRAEMLLRAVNELGQLYWAGRLTLCASREDIAKYDRLFKPEAASSRPPRQVMIVQPRREETGVLASPDELLRHRDLAKLTDQERQEAKRLLEMLAPAVPLRRSRRWRLAHSGPVDTRRTFRAMLAGLGEPARLRRHRRRTRPRRLVMLIDVSGSMARYADALLRLAHAAVQARPHHTEVFTLATRLTRVTACLRLRDVEAAVSAAGAEVPDWRGGTRLGEAFIRYLQKFGHRGMARRAVVVVCSDGWELGDAAQLGEAMAWLARLADRVIWVTPHAASPGFEPTAAGLAAAVPHVRHLLAGHSVNALAELVDVLRAGS